MGGAKNATFLQRIEMEKAVAADLSGRINRQKLTDYFQIALHRRHGFGEKRLWELLMDIKELFEYFAPAFDVRHPECDVRREHLDRALGECCGKEHPLIPFDERYDYLKKVDYGRKQR